MMDLRQFAQSLQVLSDDLFGRDDAFARALELRAESAERLVDDVV